jgi:RNA polymerase sigma-70 factor (ECF subfamily)
LLEREETRAVVRACIDELPDGYRVVLILRDIEEFSTQETAERLDITATAVKVRLHRARQALCTLLRRQYAPLS